MHVQSCGTFTSSPVGSSRGTQDAAHDPVQEQPQQVTMWNQEMQRVHATCVSLDKKANKVLFLYYHA